MTEQSTAPAVKWGEWFSGGWQMFAARWQVWVPMMLIFIVAMLIPILPMYFLVFAAALAGNGQGTQIGASLLTAGVGIVGLLVVMALVAYMIGGIYRTAFKQMRGEVISVSDLFSGGDLFMRLLGFFGIAIGAGIVIYALILSVGFVVPFALLLLIPAFIVFALLSAGALFFTIPLMVEKNLGVMDAMQRSFATTRPHIWMYGLFAIVVAIVGMAGQYACCVGALVTYPLQFLIMATAYRDVFGVKGASGGMVTPASYASPSWQQGGQQSYMPPPPQYTPPQSPQSYAPPQAPQSYMPQQPVPPVMPPAPIASDQMACPNCNALLARSAKFCNYCGKPL